MEGERVFRSAGLALLAFLAVGLAGDLWRPGSSRAAHGGPRGIETLQSTVTLTAAADAEITDAFPTHNKGSEDHLTVSLPSGAYLFTWCALVRFDLVSALPPGATIDSARLEVYCVARELHGPPNPFPVSIAARFITGPWDEMTVTWNTRPSTSAWEVRTDVYNEHWLGWHRWNATGFARFWQGNPASNHGLELCGIPDIQGYTLIYLSREGLPDPSQRPRLVLTYHLAGPSPIRLPLIVLGRP